MMRLLAPPPAAADRKDYRFTLGLDTKSKMDLSFDGFLSYSTVPDYALARKTESFLEGFHSTRMARTLKLPALSICLDGSDFELAKMQAASTPDSVVAALLYEHLAKCKRLLVFCSRNSAASHYVDLEIEWWLQNRDAHSIFLVATEGANPAANPDEIFSKRIRDASLHLRPWYDFRGFRSRKARGWSLVRDAEAERIRLTCHLHGETAGKLYPTWQQAHDRTRRAFVALAVAAGVGAVAVGSWFAWTLTDGYQIQQIVDRAPASLARSQEWVAALARADRVDEAKAIALQPNELDTGMLNALGAQLLAEGKRDEARAVYEEALQVPPKEHSLQFDSTLLANSIRSGARRDLIAQYKERFRHSPSDLETSAVLDLAKHGMFDEALDLTRSMDSYGPSSREDALMDLARIAPDPAKGLAALNEVRTRLTPPDGVSSDLDAITGRQELGELAVAYADLGHATQALDVAAVVGYRRADLHLSLAMRFLSQHQLPMVQRAVAQAGEIDEDSKRRTLIDVLEIDNGTGEDALQLARCLEPKDAERGRLLLSTVASYTDRFVPGHGPGLAAVKPMISAGTALVAASGPLDASTEVAIAKGWILAGDFPQARARLANAARLAIAGKEWSRLENLVTLSAAAKAADDDLGWIELIPRRELRDRIRTRVPIERQYGPDGRPLREWLDSNEEGAGRQGSPYEQWFAKSVAAGDMKAAIEASRGMSNERKAGKVMLDAVRELVRRDHVAQAHELTNEITFKEDKFRAIGLIAPALAKQGQVDQAEAEIKKISDPLVRGSVLGATSVALMPTAPTRARQFLVESFELLRTRDTELETIARAFCEQTDVESSRLALAKISSADIRPGIELCIVGALLKLQRLRDARFAAESITSIRHREEAYTKILKAYAETKNHRQLPLQP